MKTAVIPILATLLLAACATPEQRADRMIEKYDPYCERLGFTRNTDQWRACIQKEDARVTAIIMSD